MAPSASTSAKRRASSAGAQHDARPVSRTSRGAALRDASSGRPLSARPILSGATQSVCWAQHAPRLSLCSRTGLARSNARQRRPSSPRRDLSASPRLSSRSSCRRSMTGRRQNNHGTARALLEEMAGMRNCGHRRASGERVEPTPLRTFALCPGVRPLSTRRGRWQLAPSRIGWIIPERPAHAAAGLDC